MQLAVRDLDVRYGRVHAVRGVSIELAEGEIVAVLGANGAGKSSLLRAVLGLVRPAGGSVLFDGRDVTRWSTSARVRSGLVLVPEGRRIVMTLTNAEGRLDAANRKAGQEELLNQARSPVHMRMARAATKRAVENSFLLPLRAVGVQATVEVLFPDEVGKPTERWDESRRPEDVLANRH